MGEINDNNNDHNNRNYNKNANAKIWTDNESTTTIPLSLIAMLITGELQ